MSSVREHVRHAQAAMREPDLMPANAAGMVTMLTALLGSANQELRLREMAYKRELLQAYKTHDTANRAKIAAETSTEFEQFLEAKHIKEEIVEAIRSLKSYLRTMEEEMRLAGR